MTELKKREGKKFLYLVNKRWLSMEEILALEEVNVCMLTARNRINKAIENKEEDLYSAITKQKTRTGQKGEEKPRKAKTYKIMKLGKNKWIVNRFMTANEILKIPGITLTSASQVNNRVKQWREHKNKNWATCGGIISLYDYLMKPIKEDCWVHSSEPTKNQISEMSKRDEWVTTVNNIFGCVA